MSLTEADRALIAHCVAAEPGAWREFVDRFAGLFAHVVQHSAQMRSLTLQPADVDDLIADVFVEILAGDFAVLKRFRGQSSLAKYLIVIARRVVIRELRQRRATEQAKPLTTDVVANSSDGSRVENRDLVQRMLKGLSGTDAEVVRQFHLEGRSYREISSQLGVPENTIGPLLTRARERLREAGAADVR